MTVADITHLFAGFCREIACEKPTWPGTGPEWTDVVRRYFFCNAVPGGLHAATEVRTAPDETTKLDLVWAEGIRPSHGQEPLVLALESEWVAWNKSFGAWLRAVQPELQKALGANAECRILVTGRNHSNVPNEEFNAMLATAGCNAIGHVTLLVVLSPPTEGSIGCVARGVACNGEQPVHLGPVNCW